MWAVNLSDNAHSYNRVCMQSDRLKVHILNFLKHGQTKNIHTPNTVKYIILRDRQIDIANYLIHNNF